MWESIEAQDIQVGDHIRGGWLEESYEGIVFVPSSDRSHRSGDSSICIQLDDPSRGGWTDPRLPDGQVGLWVRGPFEIERSTSQSEGQWNALPWSEARLLTIGARVRSRRLGRSRATQPQARLHVGGVLEVDNADRSIRIRRENDGEMLWVNAEDGELEHYVAPSATSTQWTTLTWEQAQDLSFGTRVRSREIGRNRVDHPFAGIHTGTVVTIDRGDQSIRVRRDDGTSIWLTARDGEMEQETRVESETQTSTEEAFTRVRFEELQTNDYVRVISRGGSSYGTFILRETPSHIGTVRLDRTRTNNVEGWRDSSHRYNRGEDETRALFWHFDERDIWERRVAAAQPIERWESVDRDDLQVGDYVRGSGGRDQVVEGTYLGGARIHVTEGQTVPTGQTFHHATIEGQTIYPCYYIHTNIERRVSAPVSESTTTVPATDRPDVETLSIPVSNGWSNPRRAVSRANLRAGMRVRVVDRESSLIAHGRVRADIAAQSVTALVLEGAGYIDGVAHENLSHIRATDAGGLDIETMQFPPLFVGDQIVRQGRESRFYATVTRIGALNHSSRRIMLRRDSDGRSTSFNVTAAWRPAEGTGYALVSDLLAERGVVAEAARPAEAATSTTQPVRRIKTGDWIVHNGDFGRVNVTLQTSTGTNFTLHAPDGPAIGRLRTVFVEQRDRAEQRESDIQIISLTRQPRVGELLIGKRDNDTGGEETILIEEIGDRSTQDSRIFRGRVQSGGEGSRNFSIDENGTLTGFSVGFWKWVKFANLATDSTPPASSTQAETAQYFSVGDWIELTYERGTFVAKAQVTYAGDRGTYQYLEVTIAGSGERALVNVHLRGERAGQHDYRTGGDRASATFRRVPAPTADEMKSETFTKTDQYVGMTLEELKLKVWEYSRDRTRDDSNCEPGTNDFLTHLGLPRINEAPPEVSKKDEMEEMEEFMEKARQYLASSRPISTSLIEKYFRDFDLTPLQRSRTFVVSTRVVLPDGVGITESAIERAVRGINGQIRDVQNVTVRDAGVGRA